jgi:flagellar hook-associated protein 2
MPIRLSGMVSGMDTETLVSALVSGYKLKKDNLVKAQTKLSWKQEKWKTMNTSIYSFYSGKLSAGRLSNAYSLKKSTVSNSTVATVTASSSAVAGTQKLKVKKLASSGYLTGGTVKDGKANITGSSKLSDITGSTSQGSVTLSVEGKSTTIELTEDMTVNQFVVKLKDAGVQASFDENNQRFFISSKTSGAKGDFSLTANDTAGNDSLKKLGLYVSPNKASKEYEECDRLSKLTDGSTAYSNELESMYTKVTADEVAKKYADQYNAAKKVVDTLKSSDTWGTAKSIDEVTASRDQLKADIAANADYNKYKKAKTNSDGSTVKDEQGNIIYEYDTEAMKKDNEELYNKYNKDTKKLESYNSLISDYTKNQEIMDKLYDNGNGYITLNNDTKEAVADASNTKVVEEVNNTNTDSKAKAKTLLDNKISAAKAYVAEAASGTTAAGSSTAGTTGAVRIVGVDAEIELNGAKFTNNTSTFSINGLTIQATAETKGDESVTITTDTDVDAIYKSIKDMFTEYNKLIKSMDEAYNADSSKGYEPLTDEEKDAMSDKEVEKWETKIKDSLLRKDDTLNSVANTLKNDMASSFIINGKSYALSSFGISTLGYFASGGNEKGVYHIDGDKDDTTTSGNEDKLRAAIASDPETVVSFFSQLCNKVYTDLGNKMASSSVSSAYTIYNDKQMNTQYSEYNTKISDAESKVSTWEDYYYSKFSAMESALAKLNSQSSSMSGLFGS